MANFNYSHPELRDGEVFIANVPTSPLPNDICWETFELSTKRMGAQAYDSTGKPLTRWKPVFGSKNEVFPNKISS